MKTVAKYGMALVVMVLLANLLFGGGVDKDADIPTLVKNGALVIDTRTPGEFGSGHIEGAINIPYDIVARAIDQRITDKSKSIIVYCHSGARSGAAKEALANAGYTNVVNAGSLNRMRKLMAPD
ncbi:Thiosulfate sulfurtransferase PspE [Pontiella desulfatans]|uniref:Thiosulfate sulfurtransferase PspE n=1 Tax=Pontiella desulfatans TaxID=2750659 RepID=A0A6C2U9K2_PONDE|nr:rhodanese-like domain-containing protein [Pontiella desulfatans]VGO16191.1 Thiosulfate sulfurtransferase PspE [Pontiella desulfatans]